MSGRGMSLPDSALVMMQSKPAAAAPGAAQELRGQHAGGDWRPAEARKVRRCIKLPCPAHLVIHARGHIDHSLCLVIILQNLAP